MKEVGLFARLTVIFLGVACQCGCTGRTNESAVSQADGGNAFTAYSEAFAATGVKRWLDAPDAAVARPEEARAVLRAAAAVPCDYEAILESSRLGSRVFLVNRRKVSMLLAAVEAELKGDASARDCALGEYRRYCKDESETFHEEQDTRRRMVQDE